MNVSARHSYKGEMAEWSKAPDSKSGTHVRPCSRVSHQRSNVQPFPTSRLRPNPAFSGAIGWHTCWHSPATDLQRRIDLRPVAGGDRPPAGRVGDDRGILVVVAGLRPKAYPSAFQPAESPIPPSDVSRHVPDPGRRFPGRIDRDKPTHRRTLRHVAAAATAGEARDRGVRA
jgi:hypothetical protein